MIAESLKFLKARLNKYLNPDDSGEDKVVFPNETSIEPLTFQKGAVSILLINIEEEKTLRASDRYTRVSANGDPQKAHPDIKLNLYVLFVAHFPDYENALQYLSLIIKYFQSHPVFEHDNAPELSENIEKLIMELITLPFSEQNEVWNALRATYHPSVLYKVKMLVFQDEDVLSVPEITETELNIRSLS